MSDIKELKIAKEDIYKLYCIQHAENQMNAFSIMKKNKNHQKKVQIIKKYSSNFVKLGGVISEIRSEFSITKMKSMEYKYGPFSVEEFEGSKYTKGQFLAMLVLLAVGLFVGGLIFLGVTYWKEILGVCIVLIFILAAIGSSGKKEEILYNEKGKESYKKTTTNDGTETFTKINK